MKRNKTITKNYFCVKKIHDDCHTLDRAGKVILIRMRTGHNRLNTHINKKMKLVPSTMCTSNIEAQTTEHTTEMSELCYYKEPTMTRQHYSST